MAFDAVERNGKFGSIQCQRSKKSSSGGNRKRPVFLCRRRLRVKVESKVIPTSFLKIEGRGMLIRVKQGQVVELVSDQNPGSEAPPRSKREGERSEQRRFQGRSDFQESDGEE